MKIVCATNMPFAREAFETLGEVVTKDGRAICADDVRDAELLVTRSTTPISPALLDGSSVRFVGTATIGTDHLDIPYLNQRGIRWCYAPGCNANSVAEYVATALLCLAQRHRFTLAGKKLGIIGVGNVGSRVVLKARALGLRVLLNDPPLARKADADSPYLSLRQVLAESDILTLHVPLTRDGPDATLQLADRAFFGQMKRGSIFLNTARGPIVNSDALLAARAEGTVAHAVLDTWEGEPAYRPDLLSVVDLATPHIAGYSYDGRVKGTLMVYHAACRFLDVEPTWSPEAWLPPSPVPEIAVDTAGRLPETVLFDVVQKIYDIEGDDQRMRATCDPDEGVRGAAFDRLRKTYPERREFPHTRVTLGGADMALRAQMAGLGFQIDETQ